MIFRFRGFTVDCVRRSVTHDGRSGVPAAKVFDFLVYLIENRERLVPKQELLERFWPNPEISDDSLFKTVRQVRQLLNDDSKSPQFVQTAHGQGYRFLPEVEIAEPEPESPQPQMRRWANTAFAWVGGIAMVGTLVWITLHNSRKPGGEIAWFTFDQESGLDVPDASGHGNHGRYQNGVDKANGVLGRSVELNGRDSYISGQNEGKRFPQGDDPRTISAWIRTAPGDSTDAAIFSYGRLGPLPPSSRVHLMINAGGNVGFSLGHARPEVMSKVTVNDGQWHHLAAVYGGPPHREGRIYVDGDHHGSAFAPPPPAEQPGARWNIGLHLAGGTPFRGLIDDVRLYARALTHPQVWALRHCVLAADLKLPDGEPGYYLPLSRATVEVEKTELADRQALPFTYEGFNIGGVQFARPTGACALSELRGAPLSADLRISLDIQLGPGNGVEAGPFFRSRSVAPGDDVQALGQGGWWVRLTRNGSLRLCSLNQPAKWEVKELAISKPVQGFDPEDFHSLTVTVSGTRVEATLGGQAVTFVESEDVRKSSVSIGPNGASDNAAGIGFAVPGSPLPNQAPRVRHIRVSNAR